MMRPSGASHLKRRHVPHTVRGVGSSWFQGRRSFVLIQGITFLFGFWAGVMFVGVRTYAETGMPLPTTSLFTDFSDGISLRRSILKCEPCICEPSARSHYDVIGAAAAAAADAADAAAQQEEEESQAAEDEEKVIYAGARASNVSDLETGVYLQRFPKTMQNLMQGFGRISRDKFSRKFEIGLPIDVEVPGNEEVLIIYESKKALPKGHFSGNHTTSTFPRHYSTTTEAFENCDIVKVILTDPRPVHGKNQKLRDHKKCLAIMGQWESPHVHKFSRVSKLGTGKYEYKGSHYRATVPTREDTAASNIALSSYLRQFPRAMHRLRPIVEAAAQGSRSPIIVMVANFGQLHFFANFLCTASARGLDTSRIVLFATDQETNDLATEMGVHVFYEEAIFKRIPKGAAVDYEDLNYGLIMMSKVFCVHLVNALGYDLFYQDIDLVWYQDPIEHFEKRINDKFDMFFQYDGPHHPERFAPLAANTGFYFVRHNDRTEYFFSVFVRMGDLVIDDKSHQAAFSILAKEHMSLRGLRIKVLAGKESNMVLSGYHLHNAGLVMRRTKKGFHQPVLFHANWLAGKEKVPALKETNNWYFNETACPIWSLEGEDGVANVAAKAAVVYGNACCMKTPFATNVSAGKDDESADLMEDGQQ